MADPRTLPRIQAADITYLGSFAVPGYAELDYTSHGLLAVRGSRGLYAGDGSKRPGKVAVIEIPAIGGTAKIITPATPIANIEAVSEDPNRKLVAGGLFWQGRVKVSAYAYYDGGGNAAASHFDMSADLTGQSGPFRMGPLNPGITGGYMGEIPAEWQALLGGPCFTGQSALAIINRSSLGPSAHVFDPADVGAVNPVPTIPLVYYPYDHPTAGTWEGVSPYFTGADRFGGAFFPAGTRSLVFTSSHGTAAQGCYGYGTLDPGLVGTVAADGVRYCYDDDPNKGPKAYPYVPWMQAYDANDLLDVKEGRKQPWEILPYATWIFGADSPLIGNKGLDIIGTTFDPVTNRLYVSTGGMNVFVFAVAANTAPPPDVDCVESAGAWSAWAPNAEGTRESRSRVWTQTTARQGNGAACAWTANGSPATETEWRDIAAATLVDCEVRSVSKYADGDLKLTVRANTNGPAAIPVGTTFQIKVG